MRLLHFISFWYPQCFCCLFSQNDITEKIEILKRRKRWKEGGRKGGWPKEKEKERKRFFRRGKHEG